MIWATLSLIIGALSGAALMYLFDPERGARRRTNLRDSGRSGSSWQRWRGIDGERLERVRSEVSKVTGSVSDAVEDVTQQAHDQVSKAVNGASASLDGASGQAQSAGRTKADHECGGGGRVKRARECRDCLPDAQSAAVKASVNDGMVTLAGKIIASEVQTLVKQIEAMPGVRGVENRLEIHDARKRVEFSEQHRTPPRIQSTTLARAHARS